MLRVARNAKRSFQGRRIELGVAFVSLQGRSTGILRRRRRRVRAVASRARFAHALTQRVTFKSRSMTISAIAAPLLTARHVHQVKLLFQTELRRRTGQLFTLPVGLRNTAPSPTPIRHRISERTAVRRAQRFIRQRRNVTAAFAMTTRTGDIRH